MLKNQRTVSLPYCTDDSSDELKVSVWDATNFRRFLHHLNNYIAYYFFDLFVKVFLIGLYVVQVFARH